MTRLFGPTGEFPRGKLNPNDRGALTIGVTHDGEGNVIINFGTDVSWIGFPPDQATQFAKHILTHAGAKRVEVIF